ncbi:MAG: hypothetical protein WC679_12420 [Bacteroidales bacterium]|jgi:hypothetical protein
MKKKKGMGVSGYTMNSLMSGIVIGTTEQSLGTGTHMGADYMNAASKPIVPMAKIKGTTMVLKHVKKLKSPLKFKGRKL